MFSRTRVNILSFLTASLLLLVVGCGDDDNPANSDNLTGTVADIDGNIYQTVKIGDQWWMAENLRVTHYRNGDPIPIVTDDGAWSNLTTGAYCNYDNDEDNADIYGRLYNWFAVADSRNIAPADWHVATEDEWQQLEVFIGINPDTASSIGRHGTDEGGKLKEVDTTHWHSPNTGATNESGFTALPGGCRDNTAIFLALRECSFFWSSEEYNDDRALYRTMWYDESYICCDPYHKRGGFSVRCVQD